MKPSTTFQSVCVLGLLIVPCLGPFADGQQPATADNLKVQVVSVTGMAQKMQADVDSSQWTELKAGDVLNPYAVVRTGFNTQVVLQFAERGKVILDSGTKVGIAEYMSIGGQDGKVKARIGLKYGSMLLKVDKTRGANDFTVSTAVATLAVRGTEGRISFSADRGMFLFGEEGTFEVARGQRTHRVRGSQKTNGHLARSSDIEDGQRDPQMGDTSGGLTPYEKTNLYRYGSGRGILGYVGNPYASQVIYGGTSHEHSHDDYPYPSPDDYSYPSPR